MYDAFTKEGKAIAEMIVTALAQNNIEARIDVTYLDYGQDWKWETVLVGTGSNCYQALNPRQFKSMNDGSFNYGEINEIIATAKQLVRG